MTLLQLRCISEWCLLLLTTTDIFHLLDWTVGGSPCWAAAVERDICQENNGAVAPSGVGQRGYHQHGELNWTLLSTQYTSSVW